MKIDDALNYVTFLAELFKTYPRKLAKYCSKLVQIRKNVIFNKAPLFVHISSKEEMDYVNTVYKYMKVIGEEANDVKKKKKKKNRLGKIKKIKKFV